MATIAALAEPSLNSDEEQRNRNRDQNSRALSHDHDAVSWVLLLELQQLWNSRSASRSSQQRPARCSRAKQQQRVQTPACNRHEVGDSAICTTILSCTEAAEPGGGGGVVCTLQPSSITLPQRIRYSGPESLFFLFGTPSRIK